MGAQVCQGRTFHDGGYPPRCPRRPTLKCGLPNWIRRITQMYPNMFFHFSCKATLLFKQWHVTSCAEMVVSVAFLFLLAATYEALKVFCQRVQHSWFRTTRYIENDGEVVQREAHSSATASEQSIESEARLLRSNRKIVTVSCNHLLKGLFCSSLHMLQVFTGKP
uniref:uncharacterized protein isoform X5 n=1 Tax=Myxine glutinosa TaxID=7769 RepID=UPI00358DEBBB